jgi:hypothetical protein
MIRRGLEWRYPKRGDNLSPPVIDPDEYIEKTITLSFDLPLLGEEDALDLIAAAALPVPLTSTEAKGIIDVLGTNPRRLKRFSASVAVWQTVADEVAQSGRTLIFSPLNEADRSLFLKLAVIGYFNSNLLSYMFRDSGLAGRLQMAYNQALADTPINWHERIIELIKSELLPIREAALDPALWRALSMEPNLANEGRLPEALRWFRSPSDS